jgi:hypothetical protein
MKIEPGIPIITIKKIPDMPGKNTAITKRISGSQINSKIIKLGVKYGWSKIKK